MSLKQLLVLSGKGGTGKTTVSSSFIKLSNARAFADCDVDAPNMHLVLGDLGEPKRSPYQGLSLSSIVQEKCTHCGLCYENCRFGAIERIPVDNPNAENEYTYHVSEFGCEGCSVCQLVCPAKAVIMTPSITGDLELYKHDDVAFSTAQLRMGSGASGKLVSAVKSDLKDATDAMDVPKDTIAIIDGSPGIGCPVIASLAGVNMVLIVTEPSVSGISDMERIIKIAEKFSITTAICINKYDTNKQKADSIADYCAEKKIHLAGKIPFDEQAGKAINMGKTVVDIDCAAAEAIRKVYKNTINILGSC
ncbi:MAG TPA: ATP-binding protein [Treponemataceae bacterium]|nr:ATP-binding protein [Treponemataceae bacterium]